MVVTMIKIAVKTIVITALTSGVAYAGENKFKNYNAWQQSLSGCEYEGETYPVGYTQAVNDADLQAYEKNTGYRASDGYAVMMLCSFLVDPDMGDYPLPKERKFVWVAYSY